MNFEATVKDIKKLYHAITGKDAEVTLTYKGLEFGITKPWVLRIENREKIDSDHQNAAKVLFEELRRELSLKISSLEHQAGEHRKILGSFNN